MTTAITFVRRWPMVCFAVLACMLGWNQYALAWPGILTNPDMTGVGPMLAAAVVVACQGRAALRQWARSLIRWVASPWLYAIAILAPITVHITIVLLNHALGAPLPTLEQLGHWQDIPGTFLVVLVMIGFGEEAGWSAFAAPVLLRRHGVLGAWAILTAIRIVWHLPLVLTGDMPWTVVLAGNAAFQMIVLALMIKSNGQWFLAAVWHATLNAFGGAFFFTMVTGADLDRLNLLLAIAYGVAGLAALLLLRFSSDQRSPSTASSAATGNRNKVRT